jgi:cell division protein FtsW
MTEMVHGPVLVQARRPGPPTWWRTIDKITLGCILALFGIGLLLGHRRLAPCAARNGLDPFHYVERQAFFGAVAIAVMLLVSMLEPKPCAASWRCWASAELRALMLLPILGTDFGKGAVRWYSLGFASIQPSEFLKPGFVVLCAWLMAARMTRTGRRGGCGASGSPS